MDRVNILGVGIHALDMPGAVNAIESAVAHGDKGYVCVTGVHGIMEAQQDPDLKRVLNSSLLTVPDGMPTVWVGRLEGFQNMKRVFGPDLMLQVCSRSVQSGRTHFLYGGAPNVAEQLRKVLVSRFPGIKVLGTYSPPFRPLDEAEAEGLRQTIAGLKPDLFWVGLSTPKQERFMAKYIGELDAAVMIGVGAAFDIHTGRLRDAPKWMKNSGLQWLHRLMQEPKRLWKRYLTNNPKFVWMIMVQLLSERWRPLVSRRDFFNH